MGLGNYEYSHKEEDGNIVYSGEYGALVVICILTFSMLLFTGLLTFYHIYLIAFNMTTWEQMSRSNITYL